MQSYFGKTTEPHGNDDRSDAGRSIPDHVMILPRPPAHVPRQYGIQGDRDGTGKTDLTSMGMATQQHIEIGVGRLAIDLRRMGKENGKLAVRELRCGLFDIVDAIVVSIVDPRQMNALIPANDR